MFRSLGALVADLLAVILFVAIGLMQHGESLTTTNVAIVGWPFATGVLLGHLAIRAWRHPFRIWPHGVFVWAITLVTAMAVRTLFQAGTEVSFVIVTALVTAALMLGWRALALWATRGERRSVPAAAAPIADEPEDGTTPDEAEADGDAADADAADRDATDDDPADPTPAPGPSGRTA